MMTMGSISHITSLFCGSLTDAASAWLSSQSGRHTSSVPVRSGLQVVENFVEKIMCSSVNGVLGVFEIDLLS